MYNKLRLCLAMVFVAVNVMGQELVDNSMSRVEKPYRKITRTTMYGMGCMQILDTYLSPQEYKGTQIDFLRESIRSTGFLQGKVSMQTLFHGTIGLTENKADTGSELAGMLNWNYAMHYNFSLLDGKLNLSAGPMAQIHGGFIYNTRNSNNPAQAKCYINLAASGMATYHIPWKQCPVSLRYQLDVPVVGLMFSPQYRQSYYEIFSLGHYDNNIQFTSLHNQPSLRSWLTADFSLRAFTLRIGYMADFHQSNVNKIKCHTYSHAFMVGFVKKLSILKS